MRLASGYGPPGMVVRSRISVRVRVKITVTVRDPFAKKGCDGDREVVEGLRWGWRW